MPQSDGQSVRVAACQLSLSVGETGRNRAAARDAISIAAGQGARVVVLPELAASGYVFSGAAEARSLAEPADGPTIGEWQRLAARHDLVIVGGFCELGTSGELLNSAAIIDGGGTRAIYRKAHLWDAEQDVFTPGDREPPVVDTAYGRIGVMVCYDAEFPEWVRKPALAGADLLAVPTNWPAEPRPAGERPMVVLNVQAAAGGAVIAGPDGYPLAGPSCADEPAVLVADCDLRLARSKANSPRNDVHADRRAELYG